MSWASIGAAAVGAIATSYAGSQQQKASQKQTEAQLQLSQEQLAQQKELAMEQFAKELGILSGTQAGQEEALQRAQDIYGQASARFGALQQADIPELTGTPEAITRLQGLIRERALPEQQQALSRTKLAQQQAGVRGPEAALMAQQQATRMGTDLARAAEEVALKQALSDRRLRQQEALRRQKSREQFAGAQALAAQAATLRPVQKVDETKIQNTIEAQKGNLATDAEKKALQAYYSVSGEKKDFSGDYYKTTSDEELIKQMKEIGKYGV